MFKHLGILNQQVLSVSCGTEYNQINIFMIF